MPEASTHGTPKVAYSVADVAVMLGVSKDTVYGLVRSCELPHKRLGTKIVIPAKSLDAWLNSPPNWESAR